MIVGLGNPTAQHEHDRHNAGFWFVDALAAHYGQVARREAKFSGSTAKLRIGDHELWTLQPLTYMNRSGQAVAALARFFRIEAEEILVAYDELDLAPGTVRLKLGGSSTHNGLRDITAQLGGPGFWRLRIGIGHPREVAPGRAVVDYVLERPSRSHRHDIDQAIERAIDVMPDVATGDWAAAMKALHTVEKPCP